MPDGENHHMGIHHVTSTVSAQGITLTVTYQSVWLNVSKLFSLTSQKSTAKVLLLTRNRLHLINSNTDRIAPRIIDRQNGITVWKLCRAELAGVNVVSGDTHNLTASVVSLAGGEGCVVVCCGGGSSVESCDICRDSQG